MRRARRRPVRVRPSEPLVEREFEVEHHVALWPDEDVARLDVAVNEALGVEVFEAGGDLPQELLGLLSGEPALLSEHRCEHGALQQLHDDVGRPSWRPTS